MIAGSGYTGKTTAAQDLAVCIAAGQRVWDRFGVRAGRVLHLDYEQDEEHTCKKYGRIVAARRVETPDALPLELLPLPVQRLDVANAEEWLTDLVAGCSLVIVDSLRAAMSSAYDENSSGARAPLDVLTRVSKSTRATFLVLHHLGKPNELRRGGRDAIRGSSAIFDACGSVLILDEPRGSTRQVRHAKAKVSGRTFGDFALAIDDVAIDGDDRAGLRVAVASGSRAMAHAEPAMAQRVRDMLRDHPGTPLRRIRQLCRGRGENVSEALAWLVEHGEVVNRGSGQRGAYALVDDGGSNGAVPGGVSRVRVPPKGDGHADTRSTAASGTRRDTPGTRGHVPQANERKHDDRTEHE